MLLNEISYDYQFGFKKFHSTNLALIDVNDNILEHLDVRDCGVGICIALQKAFGTVNKCKKTAVYTNVNGDM